MDFDCTYTFGTPSSEQKSEPEPLLNIRLEWLDYYDDENYGLIIHLTEDSDFPIRLFMASEAGFIR